MSATSVSARLKRGEQVDIVAVRFTGKKSFPTQVVGESHYQTQLGQIVGKRRPEGARTEAIAFLVPEPDNLYDEDAVMVLIQGKLVGYLSRDDAEEFAYGMEELGRSGDVAAVDALILGGFQKEDGSWTHYGVRLDITLPFDVRSAE